MFIQYEKLTGTYLGRLVILFLQYYSREDTAIWRIATKERQ